MVKAFRYGHCQHFSVEGRMDRRVHLHDAQIRVIYLDRQKIPRRKDPSWIVKKFQGWKIQAVSSAGILISLFSIASHPQFSFEQTIVKAWLWSLILCLDSTATLNNKNTETQFRYVLYSHGFTFFSNYPDPNLIRPVLDFWYGSLISASVVFKARFRISYRYNELGGTTVTSVSLPTYWQVHEVGANKKQPTQTQN